jgi:hypothetical protein
MLLSGAASGFCRRSDFWNGVPRARLAKLSGSAGAERAPIGAPAATI